MLKISMIPVMTRMISKLNLKPTIEQLKELDIFDGGKNSLTAEEAGVLAFEIIAGLTPQLDKIGADIPEFVSLYKGVSIAEANEMDIAAIIEELKNDEGILNFFNVALRKKVEQKP